MQFKSCERLNALSLTFEHFATCHIHIDLQWHVFQAGVQKVKVCNVYK